MRLLIIIFLTLLPLNAHAEIIVDLNGFRLWQFKSAVESYFSKPLQELETRDADAKVYLVDENTYMVFEFPKKLPNNITSIQITGHTNNMLSFKGLMLGDDVEKVKKTLGEPSSITKIDEPKVFKYSYSDANYSVEINEDGKLYSIRISADKEVFSGFRDDTTYWSNFSKVLKNRDLAGILETIRPDIEIYRDGKVISIDRRYSDFIAAPDKQFVDAFITEFDSVLAGINETEPEEEFRLTENIGIGSVFKFYRGKILKEIAFLPYNGKMQVYEIAFRGKTEKEENKSLNQGMSVSSNMHQ